MPSHLRHESSFEPCEVNAFFQPAPISPPAKKQKMSLTQTYYVASTARSKLSREASKADHNLRFLVGHANMLDQLMAELADAEREQEAWFNQSIRKTTKPEEPRHIQWIDTIHEEEMEDAESDDGSDYDESEMLNMPIRNIRSAPVTITSMEVCDDDEDDDEDAYYDENQEDGMPSLTRVASKHSPPELLHDSDSDSEDDSMPSSPESSTSDLPAKEQQALKTTAFYNAKSTQPGLEDYIMQQTQQAPMIAAC